MVACRSENFSTSSISEGGLFDGLGQMEECIKEIGRIMIKYSQKILPGDSLKVNISPLMMILLRLLRLQKDSPKASGIDSHSFSSLIKFLPKLHSTTLVMVREFGTIAGRPSLVPFMPELVEILEHLLGRTELSGSQEAAKLIEFIWLENFVERSRLGKVVYKILLESFGDLSVKTNNEVYLRITALMLSNTCASGIATSQADSLFDALIHFAINISDHQSIIESDHLTATVVDTIMASSVGQVPSFMSPRIPIVIRMIGQLAAFPAIGPETIASCQRALKLIELLVHPVRQPPPIQTSTRIARLDKLMTAMVEKEVQEDKLEKSSLVESVTLPTINFQALPKMQASHFSDTGAQPAQEQPKAESKPSLTTSSLPRLPVKRPIEVITASAADIEQVSDDPFPELILD